MENDKAFDNFIRQGMENHPLPENSGDWGKMESMLSADEQLQDAEFDDFLREGVDKAAPQLPNSDWGLMESMIVSEELFSSEQFDEQINKDVHQAEVQVPQGNWGLMESMLIADELVLNQEFDSSIKENLEQIDTAPSDWDRMETMLEKDDQHGRELLYAKTIELALIVLAVVMLFRFFPDMSQISEANFPSGTIANLDESIVNNSTSTNNKVKDITNPDVRNIAKAREGKVQSIQSNQNNQFMSVEVTGLPTASRNTAEIPNVNPSEQLSHISSIANAEGSSTLPNIPPSQMGNDKNPLKGIKNEIASDNIPVAYNNVGINIEEDNNLYSSVIVQLEGRAIKEVSSREAKEKEILQVEAAPRFRLGAYVSADRNHVMSPYDEKADVSYEQNTYGFTLGAEATMVKRNMEFSTGLAYTRMKYLPKTVLEITGNTARGYEAEKLDLISYHIVSVPLSMRYYFSKYASWRFYTRTGLTMNSVFSNTNQVNLYTLPSFRNLDELLAEGPESIRKDKQGFMNGQSLGESFFLKANLGVGVERRFAKRYSVFVEPNFNYHIYSVGNGFGPNKDRINHMSLDMGVRMNF